MSNVVYYQSRGGNTKKVAEAIAKALEVEAKPITEPMVEEADILFLGSAVYAAQLDNGTKSFIDSLAGKKIGKVVLFGTSAGGRKPFGMMRKRLEKLGFAVDEKDLFIPGAWFVMNKGRPNEKDLAAAEEFARQFKA